MMDLFDDRYVQYTDQPDLSWKDAVRTAGTPLLKDELIAPEYIDNIIQTCLDAGSYMNIVPDIVLAHARPLPSTKKASMALLFSKHPVSLLDDEAHKARLWIFMATPDSDSHIELIQKLAALLMDSEFLEKVCAVNSREELLQVLHS